MIDDMRPEMIERFSLAAIDRMGARALQVARRFARQAHGGDPSIETIWVVVSDTIERLLRMRAAA